MKTSPIRPSPSLKVLAALLCAASLSCGNHLYALGYTFDNGDGTLNWADAGNWSPDGTPGTSDTISVNNGYDTTLNTTITAVSGTLSAAAKINIVTGGSLTLSNATGGLNMGGGSLLNIAGGSYTAARIFNNGPGNITVSSGSLTTTNRLWLRTTDTAATLQSSFTLSGGTVNLANSTSIYGADADDRASFRIIGSAGTFNNTGALELFNVASGFENSAADVQFTFGTGTTLTTVNSTTLVLGGNALTVDFTNIIRPSELTSFSATLFDYSGTLTGTFATPTFLGLGDGESAAVVHDTVNKLFRVDFTLAASQIPEPSTYAMLGGVAVLGLALTRRHRRS